MQKDRWKVFAVIAMFIMFALVLYLKPYSFRTFDMVLVFPQAPNAQGIEAVLKDQNIAYKPLQLTDEQIRETVANYNEAVNKLIEKEKKKENPDPKVLEQNKPMVLGTGIGKRTFAIRIPRLSEGERKVLLTAIEREVTETAVTSFRTSWGVLNSGRGPFNLGLDLQGGVQFRLEAYSEDKTVKITRDQLNGVIKVMRNRIDPTGVKEINIQIEGTNWINVEIPGERNPERVRARIKNPALLEFLDPGAKGALKEGTTVQLVEQLDKVPPKDEKGNEIFQYTKKEVVITGDDLQLAFPERDPSTGLPEVAFRLSGPGGKKFGDFTSKHVKQYLAIILDKQVISCPVIQSAIWGGSGRITGRFTTEEVQDLVTMLNAGRLPVPVKIVQETTVGPSLGRDSVHKSFTAGIYGFIFVMCFMLYFYWFMGALADIALSYYLVASLGILAMFDATLTLPGIAGLILSVGMAVDANIIIFERIKEEARAGKTIRTAIDLGFQRAFAAIVDANVTTLIGTAVLYYLGTGPIRGFAVTLSIGVLCSMFSAIIVTRMLLKRSTMFRFLRNLRWYGIKLSPASTDLGSVR